METYGKKVFAKKVVEDRAGPCLRVEYRCIFGLIGNEELDEETKALHFFGVCEMCMCEGVHGACVLWDARGELYRQLRSGPALDQLPGVRVFRALPELQSLSTSLLYTCMRGRSQGH